MSEIICLLVDDDHDDQEIFAFVMKKVGKHVKCLFANDGADAIKQIDNKEIPVPNIIFIDINMPRMDGVELLTEIKKINNWCNVPVFMYSTSAETKIVEQCKQLGAAGFIKKQVNSAHLQDILTETLLKLPIL